MGRKYAFFSNQNKTHSDQLSFFALCGRFAETEGVAALSIFVSQYKMTVKEEPQFAAETFEERKTRILAARIGLTTTWVFFSVDRLELVLMNFTFCCLFASFPQACSCSFGFHSS